MPISSPAVLRRVVALALLAGLTLAAAPAASAPPAAPRSPEADLLATARAAAQVPAALPGGERAAVPEDRYAMAGGCYTVRSTATGGYVTRTAAGPRADGAADAAEPLHFQATDLGAYLLYGTQQDFVAASDGEAGKAADSITGSAPGAAVGGLTGERTDDAAEAAAQGPVGTASGRGARVELAAQPSELADWEVEQAQDGTFRLFLPSLDRYLAADDTGALVLEAADAPGAGFALQLTAGCGAWPEVEVNVEGPILGGETPFDEVTGYFDGHLHAMAFEFIGGRIRCGRPWHPYGVTFALKGCKEHELAGGRLAAAEVALSGRDPVAGHDTNAGWPTFTDWPQPSSLTYEQVYYKWLERAWRGGLRMFTNLLVDNNQLCKIYPYKRNSCNEMDGVRLQHRRIHELQDYIDAQSGGPGEGWFRIVDDPFEARRIMNSGRLAVVLGIEVSVLFDCQTIRGQAMCDAEQIDERLNEVHDMGVRQMELVNKFDNALSGVTGDGGAQSVVNFANFLETGSFWQMKTCEDEHSHAHDKQQPNLHDDSGAPDEVSGRDSLVGLLLSELGATGAAPAYGPGPHCNQLGLSPLGEHLLRRMAAKGMIFDPDHMSALARDQAMDIIEELGYSGVISSHSWADDTIYPRVWKTGGVVTPHGGSAASFVEKWRKQQSFADDRYLFGLGYGSDMNGFSNQGRPRGPDPENPLTYPFTGLGGVAIHRQVSGEKTFDFNVDGVAHYGMYPDFVEDIRILGGADGDRIVADMQRGAEAFLQMWERAAGVPPDACRSDVPELDGDEVAGIRRGMTPEEVLLVAGQPADRGESFTYCADGATVVVRFGPDGTVTGVRQRPARKAEPAAKADATAAGSAPVKARPAAAGTRARPSHDHASHEHGIFAAATAVDSGAGIRTLVLVLFAVFALALRLQRRRVR